MSDGRDPKPEDPVAGVRDELEQQFLRVAREEPRSRVRRRLRYAGLTFVGALLLVPAAVAISGESPDRVLRDAELGSVASCEARALAPIALPAPAPALRHERALRGLRPLTRDLRVLDERLGRVRRDLGPVAAPVCPGLPSRAIRLVPRAPGAPVPAEPPGVLRADCLTIRSVGSGLEARPCALPASPPGR